MLLSLPLANLFRCPSFCSSGSQRDSPLSNQVRNLQDNHQCSLHGNLALNQLANRQNKYVLNAVVYLFMFIVWADPITIFINPISI